MANFDDIGFNRMTYSEGAAPATPSTGTVVVYAKTDGNMYQKNDAGTETSLAGAGGGGSDHKTLLATMNFSASTAVTSSTFATSYDDLLIEYELISNYGSGYSSILVNVGSGGTINSGSGVYKWNSRGGGAGGASASDTKWVFARAAIPTTVTSTDNRCLGEIQIRSYGTTAAKRYAFENFVDTATYAGGSGGIFKPSTAAAINVVKIGSDVASLTGQARIYGLTNA